MPTPEGANAPASPKENVKILEAPSAPPETLAAARKPPPESKAALWLRRSVILSFWAVVVLLGLPMWWTTTAIYRADLPLQHMTDWAEGKMCKPVFPLRVAVEAPVPSQDVHQFLQATQHALDDLNEFSAHHLRLLAVDPPLTANASQQVVIDGTRSTNVDKDTALSIRLIPVETGETPRSYLQPYSPTLNVYYSPNQIPTASSAGSPLATFIAHELHKIFAEEQAQLAYLLSTTSGDHTAKVNSLSPEMAIELQRQSTRAFKYAPTYHLTFSLFTPASYPSAWEIQDALRQYMSPLLESFSTISNFTVDTQVQLYATFSPSIQQPEYDEGLEAWTLRKEDLSGFINAAEWPLSPSIGHGPTVNFALYVPGKDQSPLLVKGSGASSWLVPQWGGVAILNPRPLPEGVAPLALLTKEALAPAMQTFSTQLISLLGLPQTPSSLPLRLSTLTRVRAASLIFSASSTLGALAQVYQKLPSIPVPDSVAKSVDRALSDLQQACDQLRDGRFQGALEHARNADGEAEKAFFERSMVGQVYFPDEHKVAVYLPLLGPVAVPLILAGLKEIKSGIAALRGSPTCTSGIGLHRYPIHGPKRHERTNSYWQFRRWDGISSVHSARSAPTSQLIFSSNLTSQPHTRTQGAQNVKSVLDGVVNEGTTGINGLVFVAIDKSGTPLITHASGTRSLSSKEPIDLDTTFWIASCTKLITTIAVLQLVEQGTIQLDDAEFVAKFAPEIRAKKVFADGVTAAEQQKQVTMRMLLAHTAGFGYAFFDPRVYAQGIDEFTLDVEEILKSPMVNQPGTTWEYGINVDWAGLILERVTGTKLNDYFQEHIFKPLGITSTTMFPTAEMRANFAGQHQRDPTTGEIKEREHLYKNALNINSKEEEQKAFHSGGAGLFTKPTEYAKVLAMLLNDGKSPETGARVLKESTVKLMWENQIPEHPNFARGGPPPANTTLANPAPELYPQEGNPPQGWGLSFFMTIAPGMTGRGANTAWWAGIANVFWWVDREKGVAGIIASQVLPFGDVKIVPAWVMAEKALYDGLK
ncbi:beta-lactamase/transpeptidase-like protein [Massarina eburnea CBS 473.64]|uniref:Beta-lactamase/transpeptidase-like protein n=1 Tax=Massarina eburnea CBS 473.64 TaxID=1395130 RepID=A0A6A6S6B4_9PLEO|nr:beta-lactamase/transpeptidase-like protein [Massarina eburnea CBS 473.64]